MRDGELGHAEDIVQALDLPAIERLGSPSTAAAGVRRPRAATTSTTVEAATASITSAPSSESAAATSTTDPQDVTDEVNKRTWA